MKTPELIADLKEAALKRRAFKRGPDSGAAAQLSAAMDEYLRMRREGVSQEDACKGLELVLRESFPPSPYTRQPVCGVCQDIGWQYFHCPGDSSHSGATCGRRFLHDAHEYVTQCDCSIGQSIRESWEKQGRQDAVMEAAAKSRKGRGWNRPGQR